MLAGGGQLIVAYTLVLGDGDNWYLRIHYCWMMGRIGICEHSSVGWWGTISSCLYISVGWWGTIGICVYISVGWWGQLIFAYRWLGQLHNGECYTFTAIWIKGFRDLQTKIKVCNLVGPLCYRNLEIASSTSISKINILFQSAQQKQHWTY